ncbi:hypothetical protein [Methylocystis sp. S23]|jgi:hypothetical protein
MTEPTRILELWASLTETQRITLLSIAEDAARAQSPLPLTNEEAKALDRSKEDFASGRVLSFDDAETATDGFLKGLRARA